METIELKVPEVLLDRLGGSRARLSQQSQFLLALKLFELGHLTSGQAAEMCGMRRVDFILSAGSQGVPLLDLDETELNREIAMARQP